MNRNPMQSAGLPSNPEMQADISASPTFRNIADQVHHDRDMQAMRYNYTYHLHAEVPSSQTLPFDITIEQGTDFKSLWMTMSAFNYDDTVGDESDFPIPNSLGVASWAGRGLSVQITDTRSGRQLTNGFVPVELLGSPGYGLNFQNPYPFKYFWYRNTKIRFDIRNRETDTGRADHQLDIALNGYKVLSPND